MKNKIENFLKEIFSIFIMIGIFGGGIIFVIFMLAIIIGGDLGASMAITAKDIIMPYFIRFASIGILAGLIYSYLRKSHGLSL